MQRVVKWLAQHLTRLVVLAGVSTMGGVTFALRSYMSPRLVAVIGVACLLGMCFALSSDPGKVKIRIVLTGLAMQVGLALLILETQIGRDTFSIMGDAVRKFLQFTDAGSRFVFGVLADPLGMDGVFGTGRGFVFAFRALPTIVFVAAFFAVLYHLGILQLVIKAMARVMTGAMGASGAESLNAAANVFMGQTEAPLTVKPYIESMTPSEILALMIAGLGTMSAGIIAVYVDLGVSAEAMLTSSVMAAPGSLMVAKIILPETGKPATAGRMVAAVPRDSANVFDALSQGASDGMKMALNVAAMLIAFLALISMVDYFLNMAHTSLSEIFGVVFAPFAFLTGVADGEISKVGDLMGTKLVANEFVGYLKLTNYVNHGQLSLRSATIATFALCGFANLGSIGIQIGGIGGLVPPKRGDLAGLSMFALAGGTMVTLLNAAIAGVILA